MRKGIAALALVFLAAHVPFLPPSLEDIDSINFALGVSDFDVARHQPHPPGYPVFIALGKVSTAAFRAAGIQAAESRGLAVWSTLSGTALVFLLFALFRALRDSDDEWPAWWATVVAALSPLFWFTALRPLSDTTGLAAAVAAQALIVAVITRRAGPRALMWGALVAGLGIGIRSQTFLLTLPVLGLALVLPGLGVRLRDRIAAVAAGSIGVLAWGIPLVVASGGLSSYAAALGSQAGEDFSGVVMLWTARRPRVVLDAAMYSFLWPWGGVVTGAVVVGIAAAGALRLSRQAPKTLGLLVVAFLPYAIFHLLFHEVVTVRYALPLVVPVAYLAVSAVAGSVVLPAGAIALGAWSLVAAVPAAATYGREGSPAFRAMIDACISGGAATAGHPVVGMHAVTRRVSDWFARDVHARMLKAPHGREWLALIKQWTSDPGSTILFVADPRRTDLALFDPSKRSDPVAYRWGFLEPPFVGGARPGDSDLYTMSPPGWMLDRGWALTAEVAGVTAREHLGPHVRPSIAWLRARNEESLLMIGGRNLGAERAPDARVRLTLNGRDLDAFDVPPGFFFRLVPIRAGALAGAGSYLPLEVKSEAVAGGPAIPVGLEQFDFQPEGVPMIGAAEGWQEPEYDPRTGRAWRWATERATLWVRPVGRDVTLTLEGESPLRYFDTPPAVTVTLAGRQVARFNPSADFTQSIALPAEALASAGGRVVIGSDKWFVPEDRGGSADKRHLALRIYSYTVK